MSDASTIHFYRDLPALSSFSEATQSHQHADVPEDWWIVIADVAGSTKAIEAGAYKDVNTVGVACIAAVVNVDRSIDLPFVFGGDGATFAIPEAMRERVMQALRAAQQLSRASFGLSLRVGLVPVRHLAQQHFKVRMGKLTLSPHVTQPVLSGRGWEEAERLVKTPNCPDVVFTHEDDGVADGSFEGFECRWQGVPSFNGHKLALLVAAIAPDAETNLKIYDRVFAKIESIYGDVSQYHPLRAERMRLSFNPRQLSHEWRVRASRFPLAQRLAYFAKMIMMNVAGCYFFLFKRDTKETNWSNYPSELVENSDFRKFDGMLRMVIDGSDAQADELERFLETELRAGNLAYGMHKSSNALLTCIVQSYNGNHQHFVDGSDGGYALAAKELKRRMVQAQQVRLQSQAASWLPSAITPGR